MQRRSGWLYASFRNVNFSAGLNTAVLPITWRPYDGQQWVRGSITWITIGYGVVQSQMQGLFDGHYQSYFSTGRQIGVMYITLPEGYHLMVELPGIQLPVHCVAHTIKYTRIPTVLTALYVVDIDDLADESYGAPGDTLVYDYWSELELTPYPLLTPPLSVYVEPPSVPDPDRVQTLYPNYWDFPFYVLMVNVQAGTQFNSRDSIFTVPYAGRSRTVPVLSGACETLAQFRYTSFNALVNEEAFTLTITSLYMLATDVDDVTYDTYRQREVLGIIGPDVIRLPDGAITIENNDNMRYYPCSFVPTLTDYTSAPCAVVLPASTPV